MFAFLVEQKTVKKPIEEFKKKKKNVRQSLPRTIQASPYLKLLSYKMDFSENCLGSGAVRT